MTLAKPLHRGVRSSAAGSSALGPPSPLLSPAQPSPPCPCPVYPAMPAVPSGWNEPSGPRPRDPFEPAPVVHPPRVPAQIKIDSALATRRVFMVPTNSAHKPVSTCRDAGTTSSPNICTSRHHALSIIRAQRRRSNQHGKITMSVRIRDGSDIMMFHTSRCICRIDISVLSLWYNGDSGSRCAGSC